MARGCRLLHHVKMMYRTITYTIHMQPTDNIDMRLICFPLLLAVSMQKVVGCL